MKDHALTSVRVLIKVHGDGEVKVFRTEGPVGVMWLSRSNIGHILCTTEHDCVVVVWVTMAKPLEVQGHTQIGKVQETDIIISSKNKK